MRAIEEQNSEKAKLYSSLFSLLSHDFKTPLTTIMSSAYSLKQLKLSEEIRNVLIDGIIEESQKLEDAINSILLLAKLENSYQLNKGVTNVQLLIKQLISSFDKSHNNIVLQIENINNLAVDPSLIKVVLYNLIKNAVQYSLKKEIVISSFIEKNTWNFQIANQGAQIPDDLKKTVFNKFVRLNNYEKKIYGLGLGLSICQKVVELHGGTINILDYKPKGTKVVVKIPL